MIQRKASKYIKDLDLDTRENPDEIKRVLRLKFLEFCDQGGGREFDQNLSVISVCY